MAIEHDIEHYKKFKDVPNGSVIVYSYQKGAVDLIESAKEVEGKGPDGPVKRWEFTTMTNWLNGQNGPILSRLVNGKWYDREYNIKWLAGYLDKKKAVKR